MIRGSRAANIPLALIVWGAIGIALNVGLARFTYGVMLPSIRRDLGISYLGSGSLNAVHLAGYLIGTLAAPSLMSRMGSLRLSKWAHLLVATGAVLCAVAPGSVWAGSIVLGTGRVFTGLGAGAGIVAILVVVFAAVSAAQRPLASAVVWSGMGVSVVLSGLAISPLLETADGWRIAFALSALLALAVALSFAPAHGQPAKQAVDPGSQDRDFVTRQFLTKHWVYLILGYLMFGIAYVAYSTFAGTQMAATNTPILVVGLTWVGFGCAAILGAALTVPIVGSSRLKQFALAASLGSGAVGAWVAAMGTSESAIIGALLVGLGIAATPTIVSACTRDRCSVAEYPKMFSLATAALGIGQLIGPVAGGALADRFGTGVIPFFAAACYGVATLLALADTLSSRAYATRRRAG
jgi:predicted MFS family arabinose efflux permease